jgi:hypothetical protein
VVKHHRTVASVIGDVLDAGFVLQALDEPAPTNDAISGRPDLALHHPRPSLLIIAARRSAQCPS